MQRAKVRIITSDVTRLRRFYEELLELKPVGDDRYLEFHAPGLTLAIASQQRISITLPGAIVPGANRSAIFDFQVEDVDREHRRVEKLVGHFVLEPTTQPWGNRSMMFRDPDGNLVNFFTRVPAQPAHN
jgi:catechol 2,3-dioxygenase-like lactoylglutathione lyase family enzyme